MPIKRVNFDDDRLLAINVRLLNNKHLTIIGAYLPSSVASRDEFCSYIDKLNELISYAATYSSVIILGDLNTQLNGTRFQCPPNCRTINIEAVFATHDLFSLTSSTICSGPRYFFDPYISGANRSLIDHVIISKSQSDIVRSCQILARTDINVSDHLPIITNLAIDSLCSDSVKQLSTRYKWNTLTRQKIADSYGNRVRALFNNMPAPVTTGATGADLDAYYASIVNGLRDASEYTIPKSRFSPFLKTRWNPDIAPLHAEMRHKRRAWIAGNRPRHRDSPLFHEYKNAKRVFRSKLRNIYKSLEREFYASVDEAACVDQNLFWSLINRKRKRKGIPSLELSVNETIYREPAEKLKVWVEYFSDMYSPSEGNEKYDNEHLSRIKIAVKDMSHKSLDNNSSILDSDISEDEITSAVKTLKTKKRPAMT